jgi:phage gpG-like protein
MEINVKIEGLDALFSNLQEWGKRKQAKMQQALKWVAADIERDAKSMCPWQTGRLRASISYNWTDSGKGFGSVDGKADTADGVGQPTDVPAGGFAVVVGTNVEYAPFVEFGHTIHAEKQSVTSSYVATYVAGRPYLSPAFFSHMNDVYPRLQAALNEDEGLK